jgi:hypothetical protein
MGLNANDLTGYPLNYAAVNCNSNGNNNLVAAQAGYSILVVAYNLVANGAVNAQFVTDGLSANTALSGLKYLAANGGICAPYSRAGWFKGAIGKTLDLNLSSGTAVGGELVYVLV